MAVIGPVQVDRSFFGSVHIMSRLDSGDFWVGSGGFWWFWVVSGGFGWVRMVSSGFMFYQLPIQIEIEMLRLRQPIV